MKHDTTSLLSVARLAPTASDAKYQKLYSSGNVNLTAEEFRLIVTQTINTNVMCFHNYVPKIYSLYGKRVIFKEKEIVLFECCEYCGEQDIEKGLYGLYVCTSCGAPI